MRVGVVKEGDVYEGVSVCAEAFACACACVCACVLEREG